MPLLAIDLELTRNSYYAATAGQAQGYPGLAADTACDVAVVGGGLAGLSAALDLRQRGFDVVLLEAQQVGFGASGRNGGQAIHGLACEQGVIEDQLGLDEARRVWDMSLEALDLLRERLREHHIACDWQDGYLSLATSARKGRELAAWAARIESVYGFALQRIRPADISQWIASPQFHSGIHDPRSGHLYPLKYTRGLARAAADAGVRIFEHTTVQALAHEDRPTLRTSGGQVTAKQVLLAGNVYLHNVAPTIEPRIMPVGTYIACSEALDPAVAASLIPSRSAVCDTSAAARYGAARAPSPRDAPAGLARSSSLAARSPATHERHHPAARRAAPGGQDGRTFLLAAAGRGQHRLDQSRRAHRRLQLQGRAWLALEADGNVAHAPLLSTTAQGSQLTVAAAALLEAWQRLQAAHRDFLRLQ